MSSAATKAKPTTLAKTLAALTRQPQPKLSPKLKSLSLTYATRNAHYGARHFVKEELPRVAYGNPEVTIEVQRKEHLKTAPWPPTIQAVFNDGSSSNIDMTQKHSSAILQELLALGKDAARKSTA